MQFCDKCDNMHYIKLANDDINKLIYYCRCCGNEKTNLTTDNICISKIHVKRNDQNYSQIINQYTKLDPTLPRTSKIKCPNQQCICNTDESVESDIIFVRYDDSNIKYIYLCSHCEITWKTAEQK